MTKHLSPRELSFVEAYLARPDKKAAAIAAGYSARSARSKGCDISKRTDVAETIARRQSELAERLAENTKLTQEWVLEKLMANVEAAELAGNFNAVRSSCHVLGLYLGMWSNENSNRGSMPEDHVPLEERLRRYQLQETSSTC